ncbi:hypothetical protein [Neisseria iguanae]|uniref:Lipoprotein n=1 Tax=Neisseria iguanae TaxID=90242 RepID=A0A2P7TZV9_9NEIS|nr:hypothetical protein [Neisseria iguanae]PSJ80254.1 hypothetical protein C7N83_07315 [Neisseria iguanae]
MNKHIFALLLAAATLSACAARSEPTLGSDRDAHGCIGSAGYRWSALKQECVQPWEAADLKLDDPANDTLAVYVILSADKAQAEIFAANVPENTVLDAVKGGYASKDGKLRLQNSTQGWQWRKMP